MAGKKAVKKVSKARKTLAPVPETEPEYEPVEGADLPRAAAEVVSRQPDVEPAIQAAVAAVAKKGKKEKMTLEEVAAAAARAAVEAMMPAVASAIISANVPKVAGAVAVVPGQRTGLRRCYLCGLDEKVCGSDPKNHVKMVVGPKRYPEFGKWFQGARINGVCFRSDHPNHKIVVPVAAIGSILAQVEAFEMDERATGQRRSGGNELGALNDPEFGGRKTRAPRETDGWR